MSIKIKTVSPTPAIDASEIYALICSQIIKSQALIIGTLAVEQASQVTGLFVDPQTHVCHITTDSVAVVEALVKRYRDLFGDAAVKVCKEAVVRLVPHLPDERVPALLR